MTKESVCICYSLSGVVLTLQTPRDGFLVNVKRAGATAWFLWHTQKAFSHGYSHSFYLQTVKCVLYCAAVCVCVCVCAQWLPVRGIMHSLKLLCQGMFDEDTFISAERRGAIVSTVQVKLIATV